MKRGVFLLQPNGCRNDSFCTRIIRPSTSITRQTPSGAGTSRRITTTFSRAESIADAGAVLITGPANAKTELVKHIHNHDPKLMNVIVGVETVDHPSDAQLVAYARKYFHATDRMQPQKP